MNANWNPIEAVYRAGVVLEFRIRRKRPIFLLGFQKSGTTAIAALLGKCTGLPVALDLHWMHQDSVAPEVKSRSIGIRHILAKNRKEFLMPIIKEPMLTSMYNELHQFFPRSTYVFLVRDPRDVIRSILNRLGIPGNASGIPADIWARMTIAWKQMFETLNNEPKQEYPDYVLTLARRWQYAAAVYVHNSINAQCTTPMTIELDFVLMTNSTQSEHLWYSLQEWTS